MSLGFLAWSFSHVLRPVCNSDSLGCPSLPWDLLPPLVAFGFWIVGIAARYRKQPLSIIIFFFVTSATLAVGLLSGFGDDFAGRSFYILLAWLSPVLFQFHYVWAMLPKKRLGKAVFAVYFLLACAWSVPFLFASITTLQALGWFPFLRLGIRLTVALALISVIILLVSQFRHHSQSETQLRIRLVFSGTVLALTPLLLLSLIPSLLGVKYIPSVANFAWLLFIPLSYGYSINNKQRFGIEEVICKIIAYYLAAVLFTGGYLLIATIVRFFVPDWSDFWAWAIAGMGMVLLFLLARIKQIVRQIANWVLYGSEKSYLELLIQMTDSLGPVLNREKLRRILVDELASTIPSTGTALFLKTNATILALQGLTGFDSAAT